MAESGVDEIRQDERHGATALSIRALEVLREEAALAADGVDPAGSDRSGNDWASIAGLAWTLQDARPAMAVVENRIDRAMDSAADEGTAAAVERAASDGIDRAARVDETAAATAAAELPPRVATLSRSSTARSALLAATPEAILVAESRPGGEGVAVAESLAEERPDTDVALTTDAAFTFELDVWDADALLVGADRILPDGSVVNKVGTRAAAMAAPADCPCYVVAATDKVATDDAVDLDPREATELSDGDAPIDVANPTFDVTPAAAIDAIFTERGALAVDDIEGVADEHRARAGWRRSGG